MSFNDSIQFNELVRVLECHQQSLPSQCKICGTWDMTLTLEIPLALKLLDIGDTQPKQH